MVLRLNIPSGTEKYLVEQAAAHGQTVQIYATALICKAVSGSRTFAEILAPFREEVNRFELSDMELAAIFETARDELQASKRGSGSD